MPEYVSKPVTVEAVQVTGGNIDEVFAFCGGAYDPDLPAFPNTDLGCLYVQKARKYLPCPVGAWVVKDTDGDGFHVLLDDVFTSRYQEPGEPVDIEVAKRAAYEDGYAAGYSTGEAAAYSEIEDATAPESDAA